MSDIGYESRLILGEVHGRHGGLPDDPAPMWFNPIIEMKLSKMGHEFQKFKDRAKYAGVFLYRTAHLEETQATALAMAVSLIEDHAVPVGAFGTDVPWWTSLKNMATDKLIEHREHEDNYGEPFKRLVIQETRDICRELYLEDERVAQGQGYRRALMATMVLEHFITAIGEGRWEEYDPITHGANPYGQVMLIHEGY